MSEPAEINSRRALRRLLGYFAPFKGVLAVSFIAAVLVGGIDSAVALAVALLMDLFSGISQAVLSGSPLALNLSRGWGKFTLYDFTITSAGQSSRLLLIIAALALGLVIIKGVVHFAKEYLLWGVTHKVLMRLKRDLFDRVVRFPLVYFDREKSGDVLSRVTFDVTQIEGAIRSGILLAKSLIYAVIFITMMFLMAWSLTLLALAVFPVSALLIKLFGDRIRRVSARVSLNVADYTSFLTEAIGGAKIIKAFGRERDQEDAFGAKIRDNYRFNMKIARLASLHAPAQDLFSSIGMVGVVIFCGYRLLSGAMTVGDLTGFIVLLTNAYKPIKNLGETNTVLQRAIASGRRIFSLLDQPDEGKVIPAGSLKPAKVRGELTFDGVRFSYNEGTPVLKGISLQVLAGETLALVGPSGGGKSTLVSLIPRFYPLREGRIELDGVDTSNWDIDHLRRQMAIVPQETLLFSGTIEENIRFGKPEASSEEVVRAAKAAHAHEFIERLNGGYQAQVGERGVQLSGGQRQRIAIARAILRDPRILLLDEATSALDSESERLIQEALDRFRQDRTTIIIAHRLSTVRAADRIAVLEDGKLVELGTHQELYQAGGLYRKLCEQQFAV